MTLCLGNIVEAFGNVAYESLACGTPCVVSRTGVHRTLLPDGLIDKVNYGDIQAAAEKIVEIIHSGGQVKQVRRHLFKPTWILKGKLSSMPRSSQRLRNGSQCPFQITGQT